MTKFNKPTKRCYICNGWTKNYVIRTNKEESKPYAVCERCQGRKHDFTTPSKEKGYLLFTTLEELQTIIINEIAIHMTPEFADHLEYLKITPHRPSKGLYNRVTTIKKDEQIVYKSERQSDKRRVRIILPSSDYINDPYKLGKDDYIFECPYQIGCNYQTGDIVRRVHLKTFDTAILKAIWALIAEFGWEGS